MNITSTRAFPSKPSPTPMAEAVRAETKEPEALPAAEPKDGFSLKRTVATGVLGFMGRRIPTTFPEMPEQKSKALQEKIKPGDILMSSTLDYPGWARMEYWAIGSQYIHAAMVGSDGQVYEAVGEGVITTSVAEFMEGRKKVAVVRPDRSEKDVQAATDYARSHLGKSYDGVFNFADDSEFYCSELVAKALMTGERPVETPRGTLFGKEAIAPDAFLKIPGIQVVHDDKSNYWKNKIGHWPIAASTVALGVAGHLLGGGVGGAVAGATAGFLGSVLVGNKIQTGHFSPSLQELREGK